jgi:hypothetical protein
MYNFEMVFWGIEINMLEFDCSYNNILNQKSQLNRNLSSFLQKYKYVCFQDSDVLAEKVPNSEEFFLC